MKGHNACETPALPPLVGDPSEFEVSHLHRGTQSEKENHEITAEKQPVLGNISVNASSHYMNRSEVGARALGKSRTDSFTRHKAAKLEIRFSDFYKSKKEFKLVQDDERRYLLEDLYETDKCYYFACSQIEIHPKPMEGGLTRRAEGGHIFVLRAASQAEAGGLGGGVAAGRGGADQGQGAVRDHPEQHRESDEGQGGGGRVPGGGVGVPDRQHPAHQQDAFLHGVQQGGPDLFL